MNYGLNQHSSNNVPNGSEKDWLKHVSFKSSPMAARFTVYCWYDKDNRIQQSNFRRWNRCLTEDREAFEVIVFHDDSDIKKAIDRYTNLRFWRLHLDMRKSPTGLMNEAIRYSRSDILVYVSPGVLARKADLYRLANYVRFDYAIAWIHLAYRFYHERKNTLVSMLNFLRWLFRAGRFELYARLNLPYEFYRASFFALNKVKVNQLFSGLQITQKESLFKYDTPGISFLNYYFFHLFSKSGLEKINAGKSSSYDFILENPGLFYSYKNTCSLIRQMFNHQHFHLHFNIYRFFLPIMQLSQVAFLILVWFEPIKSLSLLAFYFLLAFSLIFRILKKKQWPRLLLLLWFFSWLVA